MLYGRCGLSCTSCRVIRRRPNCGLAPVTSCAAILPTRSSSVRALPVRKPIRLSVGSRPSPRKDFCVRVRAHVVWVVVACVIDGVNQASQTGLAKAQPTLLSGQRGRPDVNLFARTRYGLSGGYHSNKGCWGAMMVSRTRHEQSKSNDTEQQHYNAPERSICICGRSPTA